jgi:hypothetical protein
MSLSNLLLTSPSHVARAEGFELPQGPSQDALLTAMHLLDLARENRCAAENSDNWRRDGLIESTMSAWESAEAYQMEAFGWALSLGAVEPNAELMCELADSTCADAEVIAATTSDTGDRRSSEIRARSRGLALEAARLAGLASNPEWEVELLMRVSEVLDRCGDHGDAIAMQVRALTLISGDSVAEPDWFETEDFGLTRPLHLM